MSCSSASILRFVRRLRFKVDVPDLLRLVCLSPFFFAGVALLGVLSIAQVQVQTTVLAAPAQHITRTPSRVPEIPIYGMGYNDRCPPSAGFLAAPFPPFGSFSASMPARFHSHLLLIPFPLFSPFLLSTYRAGMIDLVAPAYLFCLLAQARHQTAVHTRDRQVGYGGLYPALRCGPDGGLRLVGGFEFGEQHTV